MTGGFIKGLWYPPAAEKSGIRAEKDTRTLVYRTALAGHESSDIQLSTEHIRRMGLSLKYH